MGNKFRGNVEEAICSNCGIKYLKKAKANKGRRGRRIRKSLRKANSKTCSKKCSRNFHYQNMLYLKRRNYLKRKNISN